MKKIVIAFILAGMAMPAAAAEQSVSLKTKITSVTVYSDRAMVERTAAVTIQPGTYEIKIENLPAAMLDESIRASGEGSAKVRISSIDLKKVFLRSESDSRIKDLAAEIRKLEDKDKALADKAGVLEAKKKFLQSFSEYSTDKIEKEMALQKMDIQTWQGALSFMASSMNEANEAIQGIVSDRRDLQEKLQALRKEMDEIRQQKQLEQRSVSIMAEVESAGTWNVAVSYVIMGARWTPVYDIRALSSSKEMEIAYRAEVAQRTGEDWQDADISLSTAKPVMGAKAPELPPWYVRIIEPVVSLEDFGGDVKMKASAGAVQGMKAEAMIARSAVSPYAVPESTLTSMVFRIAKKETVLGDGTLKKVTIAIEKLRPLFDYITVPKISPVAYLRSEAVNTTDFTFLAGPANVFQDADYVGRSAVRQIVPKDTFVIDLGVDDRVKCERKLLEKKKEFLLFAKERVIYSYRITVQSFKDNAETITVVDQVPVSQDERVVVRVRKSTSDREPDEKGIIKWRFSLNPQEKKDIDLEFSIDYPKDMIVSGVE